jgi:hypothetical protein
LCEVLWPEKKYSDVQIRQEVEMKTWLKVVLVVVGILVILTCCVGVAGATYWFGTAKVVVAEEPVAPAAPTNDLINPVLHHADSQPPENGVGSFDIGVKQGQIGLAFGWHIAWPKGSVDAGGGGCDLVILTPGWYENLQVQDGRYEVYDVPSSDYTGWVKVLGQQRADEQAKDYGCPAKSFQDLPQWESPISSPP